MASPGRREQARALNPIHERDTLGGSVLLFDGVDRGRLAALGDVRTPSIADLFVAVMESAGAPATDPRRRDTEQGAAQ
jgi:ABC-2 type transport system ATP-binding protein